MATDVKPKRKDKPLMKHYLIVNPAAGNGKKIKSLIARIEAACKKRGAEFEIYLTKKVGDATEYVKNVCKNAGGPLRFFACGGDGTVNEVASGAAECENASVGIIPAGTGNDFLRCFTSPESFADIDAQLDSSEQKVDIIECDNRYILNMFNTGFDCEVAAKAAELKRLPLVSSSMAYILGVVAKIIQKPGVDFSVSLDGEKFEDKKLLLATVSNGRFCGGGFKSSPKARLADGLLDVCFVKNISRRKFISIVGKYRSGEYLDMEKLKSILEYRQAKRVDLRFSRPQNVCIDGEVVKTESFSMRIIPQKLSILIPRGSKFTENEHLTVSDAVLSANV